MFFTPAFSRIAYAFLAFSALCLRFMNLRIPSSKDWTPMLILLTPRRSSPATYSSPLSTISSGFTSTVNSSYGPPCPTSCKAWRIRSKTLRGSTDGVPPPMYRVFALSVISPARCLISLTTASANSPNMTSCLRTSSAPRHFEATSE